MSRRNPGARHISIKEITLCILLVPLVFASPQQKEDFQNSVREDGALPRSAANRIPIQDVSRLKIINDDGKLQDSDKASAIATLAPAGNAAVRAPRSAQEFGLGSSGKTASTVGGPSTLINARSLQDWEVEDFILLATVDGSIHARDRHTGAERWHLDVDRPLVESIYYRENQTGIGEHRPEDDYLWIVEPSKDGDIYIFDQSGNAGLQRPQLTIKKLAEDLSPFYSEDSAVVYTTEKKTTLFAVDAATGVITKTFSSGGSSRNDASCRRINRLEGQDDKCGSNGSIMLGRTEYTINIDHIFGGPICTLRYSEWGPNNRDMDLHGQYQVTLDRKYAFPRHDGSVWVFDIDHERESQDMRPRYVTQLPSPAVRVFDVARPAGSQNQDTQLVLLPQPPTPQLGISEENNNRNNIFVNKTEAGGWFAMSETTYPFSTDGASKATVYARDSYDKARLDYQPKKSREESLIGVHSLSDAHAEQTRQMLTISGPSGNDPSNLTPIETAKGQEIASAPSGSILLAPFKTRSEAANTVIEVVVAIACIVFAIFAILDSRTFRRIFRQHKEVQKVFGGIIDPRLDSIPSSPIAPVSLEELQAQLPITLEHVPETSSGDVTPKAPEINLLLPPRRRASTLSEDRGRTKDGPRVRIIEPSPSPGPPSVDDDATDTPTTGKKKARRGCRGGSKHKKKKGKGDDNKEIEDTVEEALQIAKAPTTLEPDIVELRTTSPSDVSGPIIQIGHLKVFTDTTLGFGSHGTVVYKGTFHGRDVAVKRMLLEFYDIASHEVAVLSVSDNHHNVIRYYDQESAGQFLYIALELCPASLQDLIERSQDFSELIGPMGLDPPNILRQITDGLKHLHSLKIVHRDLKPQNILVSTPQKLAVNTGQFQLPRILISDFGLCKKLEGDQSSFRATTAHAAGTTGWRAPELLVDDDHVAVNTNGMSTSSLPASTTSDSESLILDSRTNRRATRAIDIFSLGCVFYFVLTGGSHPFDRDGRYMREANVVKGHYSLEELAKLGDYQWEARDLIASMIHNDPRARPDAATILRHPFFWTAQTRLDFLCSVSDAFEFEPREPPSPALQSLEVLSPILLHDHANDFLRPLPQSFKDTLGKQRKYVGSRILDLLRALRNKRNHYEDMPDNVKHHVGALPAGYLGFWTRKFPGLLMGCHKLVQELGWDGKDRFVAYYSD
ncbi:MAG: hypothetical protein GOMPHAMPRED_002715 [Gomphillus americanus]|uniref:non-specific serine/threonine protein kinase n=1 Tax=Gomphillus americanus TaxID=1940652 RepID=A0A8H3FG29_9LECA|nr:MAG: hypothetical protein GOMPHAMPRED_002715 [Gomphillus americanus]